ncbi:MAG: hypothetical protein KJZ86_11160 [Caldilineaceae bacterium]|nr:hypothetical protein [Caldilineaceae bacterium]
MESHYYRYAGLRVASQLPIPEWSVFQQSAPFPKADVCIRLDRAPSWAGGPDQGAASHSITRHEYCFHIPEAGHYRVRKGREISVAPVAGVGEREVRLFLLGSAWGALCYQRGILALHASVVEVGGSALAFCGPSGAGKSSIAAGLVARGGRLLSDDLCRFEIVDGVVSVHPSAPRLKLWRDALAGLGWRADGLERDHFRVEKFHLPTPASAPPDKNEGLRANARSVPLRAIYLLAWGDADRMQLTGLKALQGLVAAATYRGDLLEPMGEVASHWQRCAVLAQRVPIRELRRPQDWSGMDKALDLLLDCPENSL